MQRVGACAAGAGAVGHMALVRGAAESDALRSTFRTSLKAREDEISMLRDQMTRMERQFTTQLERFRVRVLPVQLPLGAVIDVPRAVLDSLLPLLGPGLAAESTGLVAQLGATRRNVYVRYEPRCVCAAAFGNVV